MWIDIEIKILIQLGLDTTISSIMPVHVCIFILYKFSPLRGDEIFMSEILSILPITW